MKERLRPSARLRISQKNYIPTENLTRPLSKQAPKQADVTTLWPTIPLEATFLRLLFAFRHSDCAQQHVNMVENRVLLVAGLR